MIIISLYLSIHGTEAIAWFIVLSKLYENSQADLVEGIGRI
jgi:hypothetical protein